MNMCLFKNRGWFLAERAEERCGLVFLNEQENARLAKGVATGDKSWDVSDRVPLV